MRITEAITLPLKGVLGYFISMMYLRGNHFFTTQWACSFPLGHDVSTFLGTVMKSSSLFFVVHFFAASFLTFLVADAGVALNDPTYLAGLLAMVASATGFVGTAFFET